jgi:hypothetical protein
MESYNEVSQSGNSQSHNAQSTIQDNNNVRVEIIMGEQVHNHFSLGDQTETKSGTQGKCLPNAFFKIFFLHRNSIV